MKTIFLSLCATSDAPMCCVMPPASRSATWVDTYRVEQRCLTVIDVAHDRDHRRARHLIFRFLREFDFPCGFFFEAERVGRRAEVASQILRHLYIKALVDGRENLAIDEFLDHEAGFDAELLGQFLDRDAFTNRDFTIDRRGRDFLALRRRPKLPVELPFHVALAIHVASGTWLCLVPATGFGRGRSCWFDTAERRGRMPLRTATAHLRRTGRRSARGRTTRSSRASLSWTQRATENRLSGRGLPGTSWARSRLAGRWGRPGSALLNSSQ